jgi:6,7-dimethyl-8-ribityllumazine synthase
MHYEFISQAIFNGIVDISIAHPSKTLISGILTVEDKNLLPERISDNFARSALNLWREKQKIA